MVRALLVGGVLTAAIVVGVAPPTANADAPSFINYLQRNGLDTSTDEIRSADIGLGNAICNAYATTGNNDQVGQMLMNNGHSTQEAAIWLVGSVMYLCPRYEYLLP